MTFIELCDTLRERRIEVRLGALLALFEFVEGTEAKPADLPKTRAA